MKYKKRTKTDLSTLSKDELLETFADRVLAYEGSGVNLHLWEMENGWTPDRELLCAISSDKGDGKKFWEHDRLKMEHDENFCLVRECVRFIKKDETLLACAE